MARLRERHLPHRVIVTRLEGEGAEGPVWAAPVVDLPAYVEQKTRLVIDRRSTSQTFAQEVVSSTLIVMLPGAPIAPGTLVTVFGGTGYERTSAVIDSSLYDYVGTPNHIELRLE